MFDPGAFGTLLIGLNAEREEAQNDRRGLLIAARRREQVGVRTALVRDIIGM